MPGSFDVFFSYNTIDHGAVTRAARALHERGIRVFLDRWYLAAGQPWPQALEQTLESCSSVAIFVGAQGLGPWQQRERDLALDRQAREPGFPVIPVLLSHIDPALGFLRLNTWVDLSEGDESAIEILAAAIRREAPGRDATQQVAALRAELCPYRGLRPFREEDEPFFFGRAKFTETLATTLGRSPLVAVIGASGSGKSSIVRAGLIPRLRRGEGGFVWEVVTLVPTDRPLASLSAALLPVLEPDLSEVDRLAEVNKLAAHLAQGSIGLGDVAARILEKQPGTNRLMLFVDQWEELYTLSPDEQTRRSFTAHMLQAAAAPSVKVVLTMRGDFFGRALADRALSDQLQDAVVTIGPMTREELAETISKPAEKTGLAFEAGLAETILDDMGDEPGSLPLLEFLLEALWHARRAGLLIYDSYRRLGRVSGAIAHRAEDVFEHWLSETEQQAAQRLLIRMVRPGEGAEDTRQRTAMPVADPLAESTIQKLADARLIVTERDIASGREVVEVAHEALIRNWQRLRDWVDQDREFLRTRERIAAQARLWEDEGRSPDRLLSPGRPLAEGEDLIARRRVDLEERLAEFILASSRAEAGRREAVRAAQRRQLVRTRLTAVAMLLLSVLVGIAALFAWRERDSARQAAATASAERDRAEQARNLALVRQLVAQAEMAGDQTGSALLVSALLGAEAMKRAPSVEADQVIRRGLALLPQPVAGMAHEDRVNAVTFSPDGRYLASASSDKTARIWEVATGRELTRVTHSGAVKRVVFSPDGKRFASASDDHTAGVWETASGREIMRANHDSSVNGLAFSPDGHYLATASLDKTARLWDIAAGREVARLPHGDTVNDVVFAPDGRRLATASGYPSSHMTATAQRDDNAHLWELPDAREVFRLPHQHNVWAVAFSPDGKHLASASTDGAALLADIDGRREIIRLEHDKPVKSLAFSPNGRFLATAEGSFFAIGSGDYSARVWSVPDGREILRVTHQSDVNAVAFSPDSRLLATASQDETARLWDLAGREVDRVASHSGVVGAVTFSPDGKSFATASSDRTVRVWQTGRPEPWITFGRNVPSAIFSRDGKYLAGAKAETTASVWELSTGTEVARLPHGSAVLRLALSPDSRYVATVAQNDLVARVWEAQSGRPVAGLTHQDQITAIAFGPDGKWLATGSHDGVARIWDTRSASELLRLACDKPVSSVAFSPDGRYLATSAQDHAVRLWDAGTGQQTALMQHQRDAVEVVFNPGGDQVITTSGDEGARIWEVPSGRLIAGTAHDQKTVNAVAFSPDGRYLATGGSDTRIREAASGREIMRLPIATNLGGLSFAPDGRHIATGAHDRIARVWEVETGREVARVVHESEVERVAFDAAGRYLLTTSGELLGLSDHVARVSPWRPGDLIEEICGRLTRNLSLAEWQQYLEGEAYRATCPDIPGHAIDMLKQADELAWSGQRELAASGFKSAIDAVGRERDAQLANSACWFGAIDGFADIVLSACERAVSLAEEDAVAPYRDSRGVARALGGDRAGAIEDFKFFVSWAKGREATAQEVPQRQAWVATLQSGGNPFDAETLKALRNR